MIKYSKTSRAKHSKPDTFHGDRTWQHLTNLTAQFQSHWPSILSDSRWQM